MSARIKDAALCALLAAGLSSAWFLLFGDVDLNFADEGWLWHGVQRTLDGEVPIRDFQSYDPGRYYWCAAWARFLGRDVLALRQATAIFGGIGLFFALCALARVVRSPVGLAASGAALTLWLFPHHKLFEPAFAMIAVWAGARLIERPSAARHVAAGAVVGLAGFFGRNLGLYALLGEGAIVALLAWKLRPDDLARRVACWLGGIALGSLPLLVMLVLVPGFAASFVRSVADLAQTGLLPLPYPWPWRSAYPATRALGLAREIALSIGFLIPVLAYPLGIVAALRTAREQLEKRCVAIAAAFVGVFWIHHAAVRSDPPHLADAIPPALILVLAAPGSFEALAGRAKAAAVRVALLLVSFLASLEANPALAQLRTWPTSVALEPWNAGGAAVRLPWWTMNFVRTFTGIVRRHVNPGERMFFAPTYPGLYPMFDQASPTYTTYFWWAESEARQERSIAELEEARVVWAWIALPGIDGREELSFPRTNPLVWEYLQRAFEPVADETVPKKSVLLRRRR